MRLPYLLFPLAGALLALFLYWDRIRIWQADRAEKKKARYWKNASR